MFANKVIRKRYFFLLISAVRLSFRGWVKDINDQGWYYWIKRRCCLNLNNEWVPCIGLLGGCCSVGS